MATVESIPQNSLDSQLACPGRNIWRQLFLVQLGNDSAGTENDDEVSRMSRQIVLLESKIEEQNKRIEALNAEVRARYSMTITTACVFPHF